MGVCCATGLGITALEFYTHLPFARWLVVENQLYGVDRRVLDERCEIGTASMGAAALDRWLDGLDTVFAIQYGYLPGLWARAKRRGIRTVLTPNAEAFVPANPEMSSIDLFIAPTRDCAELLHQTGFGGRTCFIPRPVDTDRFRFRRRERASVFLHSQGTAYRRKGTDLVLEAARRCPEVPFVIHHQTAIEGACPDNVRLVGAVDAPEELYLYGDVAVQPSRYEGVGRSIQEAMSCGLPTITTDAPPMNEFPSERRFCIPARSTSIAPAGRPFASWDVDIDRMVALIRQLHRSPIGDLSDAARAAMLRWSWLQTRPAYLAALRF